MDGTNKNCGKHFDWKFRRKEPLPRSRSRWKDNIKLQVRDPGWMYVDLVPLVPYYGRSGAFVNTVINLPI
jgi:hypothetical protein